MQQVATWYGLEIGGPGHNVLDGDPASPQRGQSPPNFRSISIMAKRLDGGRLRPRAHCARWDPAPHVYRGQTARWIKMPLGTEIGLGPGDFVLDGNPAPQIKGHSPRTIFGPYLLWPNGWMDEDATWCGSRPGPRSHSIRRDPSSPRKGHSSPPSFRSVSIVATVAHVSYC